MMLLMMSLMMVERVEWSRVHGKINYSSCVAAAVAAAALMTSPLVPCVSRVNRRQATAAAASCAPLATSRLL